MAQKLKRICHILLIMNLGSIMGCSKGSKQVDLVLPRPNGTKSEQIQYHKKEVERFSLQKKMEEKSLREALFRQDMDKAREAQNRRMQYQKKINSHLSQLNQLMLGETNETF